MGEIKFKYMFILQTIFSWIETSEIWLYPLGETILKYILNLQINLS